MARLPDSLTFLSVSGACVAQAALTKTTARSRGISDRLMRDSFGVPLFGCGGRRYRTTPPFPVQAPGPRRNAGIVFACRPVSKCESPGRGCEAGAAMSRALDGLSREIAGALKAF